MQRVEILLVDDIDGGEGAETVSFGLDGATYEIDLSEKNAKELRNAMSAYVAHGRRVTGKTPARRASAGYKNHTAQEVRDWARTNKLEIPERGRIPNEIQRAFEAAH